MVLPCFHFAVNVGQLLCGRFGAVFCKLCFFDALILLNCVYFAVVGSVCDRIKHFVERLIFGSGHVVAAQLLA